MNDIGRAIALLAALQEETVRQDYLLEISIDALHAQQERENPKPLTLEELRERNGKWVWLVKYVEVYGEYAGAQSYGEWKRFYSGDHDLRTYGNRWEAYDHPPKEAKHEQNL